MVNSNTDKLIVVVKEKLTIGIPWDQSGIGLNLHERTLVIQLVQDQVARLGPFIQACCCVL